MKPDLQGVFDTLGLEQLLATMEFLGRAVGQARIETYVFLVVRETPESDPKLQLLGNGRINMFNQFEWDVGGNATGSQFRQGN